MTAPPPPLARFRATVGAVPAWRWRLAFAAVLAVVAAVAAARYAAKVRKPAADGTLTRSAFLRWRPQIVGGVGADGRPLAGLTQGADAYRRYNYPNPPVMAVVLWPFFLLPPTAGALAWFAVKAAMAVGLVGWAVRLAADPGRPLPDPAVAAVAVLSLHPLLGDLAHGNVNIFVGFLVAGGLELFRRRADAAAGLALGLAAACKVTPALFLPYLAWKRAGRAAAGMTAGLLLGLFVVPGLAFGCERNLTLLESWYVGMVKPFVADGKVTPEHANQSIPGLAARLLTDQPSDFAFDEDDGRPVGVASHTVVDLGPGGARWVVRGCQAAFAAAGLWLLTCPRDVRQGRRAAGEAAFVLLGMLLFSERTWKHHAVTLAVPFAVLASAAAAYPPGRVRRAVVGLTAAAGVLAIGPSLFDRPTQDEALAYGSHTAAFVLLTAAVGVVLVAERRAAVGGAGG